MKISNIKVNKILDSRGEETIEVEIFSEDLKTSASIPSGKSVGSYEAKVLDFETIQKNLENFLKDVKNSFFSSSKEFDEFLIERAGKNKENLGANFTLGCSLAFSRLIAKTKNKELYEYLKEEYGFSQEKTFANLMINVIGGGVHSHNNLDFQEYWLVSKDGFNEKTLKRILEILKILEKKLPKPLGKNDESAFVTNFSDNYEAILYLKEFNDFDLGLDIASNQIQKMVNWQMVYEKLKVLEVKYLEDPFKEDEFEYFANLRKEGFKVIGDDLTVTNSERLKVALEKDSLDGVIVKPNQIGTIYETFEFARLAKENNLFTIFSHRSGETTDDWLIDLGVAFNTQFFKIGVPRGGERVIKYNRLMNLFYNNK